MASPSTDDAFWTRIASRLAPSRSYWLGTTNRDGFPHVAPVWGVVVMDSGNIHMAQCHNDARGFSRN